MTETTVLLIAHSSSREGRISALLEEKGYALQWCCPAAGDRLPAPNAPYAGAVVFGGVQSANDGETLPYIRDELDWIGAYVGAGRPFLGICLGAQMLARVLGAKVDRHPAGLNEIGYYPVTPTPAGRDLLPGPMHVYHWHKEGFEVPRAAELLAVGETFPNQAFRYGRHAYGLQFHPEVTPAVMRKWLDEAGHLIPERPGGQCEAQQLAGSASFDAPLHDWTDGFLDRWLGLSARALTA